MKVSLISTIYNEESSIREFLDALVSQSRKPDEIVIVDGGSTDRTVQIIKEYPQKEVPIKLIVKKGANISQGRNIAIKNTKYDIIASTDAGCRLDKDWLKNLIKKFDNDTHVVGGMTIPESKTDFERCVAEITTTKLEEIDEKTFLPSARSIAFRKSAWKSVGGYPEWLYTSEDTQFDLNLKKKGFKFKIAKDAVVYWQMRKDLKSLFKQYYLYAKGSTEAGRINRIRYVSRRLLTISGLISMVILLPFIDFYLTPFWGISFLSMSRSYISSGLKCYEMNRKLESFYYGFIIQFILDISQIAGAIRGKMLKNNLIEK